MINNTAQTASPPLLTTESYQTKDFSQLTFIIVFAIVSALEMVISHIEMDLFSLESSSFNRWVTNRELTQFPKQTSPRNWFALSEENTVALLLLPLIWLDTKPAVSVPVNPTSIAKY